MKPTPTQARARLKRAALIDASIRDFSEHGYEGTTAKTIAARAGVATGTFYQHFDNKDDALRVIAQQRIEHLHDEVSAPKAKPLSNAFTDDIDTTFRRVLTFIYDFHEQTPQLHQVLELRRHNDMALDDLLIQGERILELRVLRFVQCFNVSTPEAVAFNLFAMAEGLVHRHVFGHSTTSKDQVLTLGATMLASYFEQQQGG